MASEQRGPAVGSDSNKKEGKGEMIKTPISLQSLRKSLYVKAKAEPTWRFWGLYVHVCKMETLQEAYQMAKSNDGAPGTYTTAYDKQTSLHIEAFTRKLLPQLLLTGSARHFQIVMLKRRCHAVDLVFRQVVVRGFLAPLGDDRAYFLCDRARLLIVELEIVCHC